MKSKRGQTMGLAIMSAIFIFIIGMMSINFIITEVTNARTDLNCSDGANISDASKLTCLIIDTSIPYWILLIFSVSMGGIIARMYL